MSAQDEPLLPGRQIPEDGRVVTSRRGERLSIRREGERLHGAVVPLERGHLLAGRDVPQTGAVVEAAAGERLAVGREGDGVHVFAVAGHHESFAATLDVPQADQAVVASRGEQFSIRRKGDRIQLILVPCQQNGEFFSRRGVPQPGGPVEAGRRQCLAVGSERDTAHVGRVPRQRQLLGVGHVPQVIPGKVPQVLLVGFRAMPLEESDHLGQLRIVPGRQGLPHVGHVKVAADFCLTLAGQGFLVKRPVALSIGADPQRFGFRQSASQPDDVPPGSRDESDRRQGAQSRQSGQCRSAAHPFDARRPPPTGRAAVGFPARNRSRSSDRASAVSYRRAGSFSRHLRQIASRSRGTSGRNLRSGGGSSKTTRRRISGAPVPRKGVRPVKIS